MINNRNYHIGVVGTGFIARGFLMALKYHPRLIPCGVLTRRPIGTLGDFPLSRKFVVNDIDRLIRTSDLIVECTGDAIHATDVVERVLKAGLPVVTLNPELQITSGTMLARMGTLIEAEGDQPGTIAALTQEAKSMGFKPTVYGNIKRFLNLTPNQDEMVYWAKRQGISIEQVTAFTDGSKVQIEQALVANGLGATIAKRGLSGVPCTDHEDGAQQLAALSEKLDQPISDYVLSPTAPAGVFIVATHDKEQRAYLEYLKLGKGPFYTLTKPHHLCHLEIAKTVMKVLNGDASYSFNNGQKPTIQVGAVAKRAIEKGEITTRGLGSFSVRGEALKISDHPQVVPITLMHQAEFVKPVSDGELISFNHVKLPSTLALQLWKRTVEEFTGKILETPIASEKVIPQRTGAPSNGMSFPIRLISSFSRHLPQLMLRKVAHP